MAKTVRLSDIGKRLQVSTVTVSKALSGQKGVSEEMRCKILDTAREMGYKRPGDGETTAKNKTIGVITAERFLMGNEAFYLKLYQKVSQRAMEARCFTILEVITHGAETASELPRIITEKKVDGLIVMGSFRRSYISVLAENITIPYIFLDTTASGISADAVITNNFMGGCLMTEYLLEMGHSRIGYVGTRLATDSIDNRFFGYVKALMSHGIGVREDWLVNDRDRQDGLIDAKGQFRLPDEMPTAFFCNCDLAACMLIRKLNEAGLRVPEDISVVGFDNYIASFDGILDGELRSTGLTTYDIGQEEMALQAVRMIMDKIDRPEEIQGMQIIAGHFVERGSSKRIGPPVPCV